MIDDKYKQCGLSVKTYEPIVEGRDHGVYDANNDLIFRGTRLDCDCYVDAFAEQFNKKLREAEKDAVNQASSDTVKELITEAVSTALAERAIEKAKRKKRKKEKKQCKKKPKVKVRKKLPTLMAQVKVRNMGRGGCTVSYTRISLKRWGRNNYEIHSDHGYGVVDRKKETSWQDARLAFSRRVRTHIAQTYIDYLPEYDNTP